MRRDVLKLLEDARAACEEVELFINGGNLTTFVTNLSLKRSVERSLEIIGEALRRLRDLDPEVGDRIPNIHRIIGLRNIIAHGYDVLDYEIIWDIATQEVPELRSHLTRTLELNGP